MQRAEWAAPLAQGPPNDRHVIVFMRHLHPLYRCTVGVEGLLGNFAITLKIPQLGYQSVSDTWGPAKVVRKVEFKLLHIYVNWLARSEKYLRRHARQKVFDLPPGTVNAA